MSFPQRKFSLVVALLCVVATGAACARTTQTVASPAAADQSALDGRLLAMIDLRERDTLLVDALLRDGDSPRRARATLAIGQVQLRSRYDALRRLLLDADTAVAANAAFALGLAHDSASLVALGRAVAGAPDVVAREAAWALGELGDVARGVLVVALGDSDNDALRSSVAALRSPVVRAELLMATAKLRVVPVSAIVPWLADTSVEVVRGGAYAIARPRVAAGAHAMIPLARHRDEVVRQYVGRTLVRTAVADSLAVRARVALEALVADTSPRVRMNAVRSLATFGPSVRARIESVLRDVDANVRIAAAENIGTVFLRDSSAWRSAWRQDSTFTVRRTLLVNARRAGSDALAAAESSWVSDADWRARAAVVEARLAGGLDRGTLARAFANDRDSRVRAAALGAIDAATQDASGDARALLRTALRDTSVQVRTVAIGALSRRAVAVDLPAVLDASAGAARDEDLRVSTLRFLAAAWQRDSVNVSSANVSRLRSIPLPSTVQERMLVARVTPLASWASAPVAPPRAQSEYDQLARCYWGAGARRTKAVLHTSRGDIRIELLGESAPLVVEAFLKLARDGYYRDSWFHRVVPNFVAQDGNPRGDGSGGPGGSLRDAWTRERHDRGAIGLATSGPDTGDAQYYLCHSAQPHLDGHYTVFARVTSGFDVLDRLVQGDRLRSVEIQ